MVSPGLAIAKASLVATFMRPDPVPLSRDELSKFHELLESTLKKCSSSNIQRCKEWLLKNNVASTPRAIAIVKYFVALTSSLKDGERKHGISSQKRQQIHVLYLLNDLLHHYKYHERDHSSLESFLEGIREHIPECLRYASAYDGKVFPRQKQRTDVLLKDWAKNGYFDDELQIRLEDIASSPTKAGQTDSNGTTNSIKKETPYIMPAIHGDPLAPYHELPAGNMMPHIIPNTSIPINSRQMRAMQFTPGPAEPALVEVVKSFLKDVDLLYSTEIMEDEGISMEMDSLGQNIVRDTQSHEILSVESYYGWSKEFCERMKRKQNPRRRSRSRSSGEGKSDNPRKKRRYGDTRDSRSRSRSYSRSKSPSRSRSNSPPRRTGMGRARSRSWSRSQSRSRSRSRSPPKRVTNFSQTQAPVITNQSVKALPQQFSISQPNSVISSQQQQIYLPPQPAFSQVQIQPPPLLYNAPYHNNSYQNSGLMPPPRPMNWQGPWPPAPPPPPPSLPLLDPQIPLGPTYGMQNQQPQYLPPRGWQGMGMGVGMDMGMPALPPPPPPPQMMHLSQQPNNGYSQGYNQGYNAPTGGERGGYGSSHRGGGDGGGGNGNGRGRGGRW